MLVWMFLLLIGSSAVLGSSQTTLERFEKWPQVSMCKSQDFGPRNSDSMINLKPEYSVRSNTDVEEKLREQVERLKSLIYVVILDNDGIRWEHDSLRSDILHLHQYVMELESYNKEYVYILSFVEVLFDFVVNAAGLLEFHSYKVGRGQSLIENLIRINAEIFDLIDEKGLPDLSIKKYTQAVSVFSKTLSSWDEQRRNMTGLSFISNFFLEGQFRQAEEVLALLQSCAPQDEETGVW